MIKKILIVLGALLLLEAVLFLVFFSGSGVFQRANEPVVALPEPEPEPLRCLLDNEIIDAYPEQLYIISVDNNPSARPATGLTQAEIVYELPAEAGISRYLMFFYHNDGLDKIGPVRSARPYMIDVCREWGGAFLHCGGSLAAYDYLKKGTIPSLNEIYNPAYFYRDKSRFAPHNLYTSSELLAAAAADKGWQTEAVAHWQFADEDSPPLHALAATSITIKYRQAGNSYVYDEESGLYLRSLGDKPQVDALNDRRVTAKNILIQQVSSKVLDSEGRLQIDMTAGGKAWYFVNGTVEEGSWSRESLSSRTFFYGADGSEWLLAEGQTWVEVIDQNVVLKYE